MTGDHLYVYGIVEDEELELDVEGVAGAEQVYAVTTGGLSAVVSDIDTTDPERTTEAMETHDGVLKALLEDRTVVPMSFGMAFADEQTLRNVLGGGKRAFRKALDEVEGTVELGVKVVSEADADLRRDPVREETRNRLEPIAVDVVGNDLFSDRLLVNDAYLVERDDREAFDHAVGDLEQELDGVVVQYTGPFAPYNFVDIHVGAEQ